MTIKFSAETIEAIEQAVEEQSRLEGLDLLQEVTPIVDIHEETLRVYGQHGSIEDPIDTPSLTLREAIQAELDLITHNAENDTAEEIAETVHRLSAHARELRNLADILDAWANKHRA